MRPTSVGVILCAALSLAAVSVQAAGKDAETAAVNVPPQLQAAVARLAAIPVLSKMNQAILDSPSPLHYVDQQPSVVVGDQRGYRVIFRNTWMEAPPGHDWQQAVPTPDELDRILTVPKHSDWHFVLFPLGNGKLPEDAKREILWPVPDEKQFRLPVALGEGEGFAWFTYTSIPLQHFVRRQLKLTGGDDGVEMLVRGLSVQEESGNTLNSILFGNLFSDFGERGFAALDELSRVHTGEDKQFHSNAIRCMAGFQDARATDRLVELYFRSPYVEYRQAAATALIIQPIRPAARLVYLDMIRTGVRRPEAIEICLKNGWKEALPALEAILEKPASLPLYLQAYDAYRQLSGNPFDARIVDAVAVMRRQYGRPPKERPSAEETAIARQAIVASADVEAAAYFGLSFASLTSKAGTEAINEQGLLILRELPRPLVERKFKLLLANVGNEGFGRLSLERLYDQVQAPAEAVR